MRRLLVFMLIALAVLQNAPPAFAQRRRSPRSAGTNLLDMLGILPESVKSILVLYLARNATKEKAGELEAELRTKPDNTESRLTLIGYYSWNGKNMVDRVRLRTHVVWFVENHPEHPATQEPILRDLPDDREGNALILAQWEKNLETRGNELEVLKNAEKFFFSRDPAQAEEILHRLAQREPLNEEWPRELALLYRMFGVPNYRPAETDDAAGVALEGYRRVLELTRGSAARETLAGDMAESAFKAGDFTGAAKLAKLHLESGEGSAVHRANTILGRVALRSDDIVNAKRHLIDSSRAQTAHHISTWGPRMILAKELLDENERDTVVEYLQNCLLLWPRGENLLHYWIADIKSGRKPNFGNLGLQ